MNNLPPKDHPIWKLASNFLILTAILAVSASDFDATELQTIGMFLGGNVLVEKVLHR